MGQRTHQSNGALPLQRQQLTLVLEQHKSLGRHVAGRLSMCIGIQVGLQSLGINLPVRILKKAQLVLGFEHTSAGIVNLLLCHQSLGQAGLQLFYEGFGTHVHIGASLQRTHGALLLAAQPMGAHLVDAGIVGDQETVESPFFAQKFGNKPVVGCGRYAIHHIER